MKKGFTLIELLAVIVILAIIALIATPIVLDIIEDSKNSSIKRSIELYADAVENSVAKAQLNGNTVPSGKYTTTDGKILTQGETTIKVDYDGAKTICDVVISNKGHIYLENCSVSDKDVDYTYGNIIYYNGRVVYFDVTTGKTCDNYTESQSITGVKDGCMKFYTFNDDGGDKVNLILDHNTTTKVAWVLQDDYIAAGGTESDYGDVGNNNKGPLTVIAQLKSDTSTWDASLSPRLIEASEIAKITENTTWNAGGQYYILHTNSESEYEGDAGTNKYAWLFDNTHNCTSYGCNVSDSNIEGYWTGTAYSGNYNLAWAVSYYGVLNYGNVDNEDGEGDLAFNNGVRPVITVLKSKLK